jgi:hypothetical protein
MSNKIVYLFGAGASANAIPPYQSQNKDSLYDKLKEFAELKNRIPHFVDKETFGQIAPIFNDATSIFNFLTDNNLTFDEYARELFISDHQTFNKLKKLLTCLFYYIEVFGHFDDSGHIPPKTDFRYRKLLSHFLDQDSKFDSRVTLLTWNYDSQIIKTFKQLNLTVYSGIMNNPSDYSIPYFPLNGSACVIRKGLNNHYFNCVGNEASNLSSLANELAFLFKDSTPSIKFAFEKSDNNELLDAVKTQISGANKLIVIGYSFPSYNSFFDSQILKHLIKTCDSKLEIVFQNNNYSLDDFKLKFAQTIAPYVILNPVVDRCDKFHLPHEYYDQ